MRVMQYTVYILLLSVCTIGYTRCVDIECTIQRNHPVFKQCNDQWGNDRLGSSSIVCKSGSIVSSIASGLASLGILIEGSPSDPKVLNQYFLSHNGYTANAFNWDAIRRFGFRMKGQYFSKDQIADFVCREKLVLLKVGEVAEHWILATGVKGTSFYVIDPSFNKNTYEFSEVISAVIYDPLQ